MRNIGSVGANKINDSATEEHDKKQMNKYLTNKYEHFQMTSFIRRLSWKPVMELIFRPRK